LGEKSELFLPIRPRTKPLIYFWRDAARQSWRLESGCQKKRKHSSKI